MRYTSFMAVLAAGLLVGQPASAQQTFSCKFDDSGEPCRQTLDGVCQKQLEPKLWVTCGGIAVFDIFVCFFTDIQFAPKSVAAANLGTSKQTVFKSLADPKYKAGAAISPIAGELQAALGKHNADCMLTK